MLGPQRSDMSTAEDDLISYLMNGEAASAESEWDKATRLGADQRRPSAFKKTKKRLGITSLSEVQPPPALWTLSTPFGSGQLRHPSMSSRSNEECEAFVRGSGRKQFAKGGVDDEINASPPPAASAVASRVGSIIVKRAMSVQGSTPQTQTITPVPENHKISVTPLNIRLTVPDMLGGFAAPTASSKKRRDEVASPGGQSQATRRGSSPLGFAGKLRSEAVLRERLGHSPSPKAKFSAVNLPRTGVQNKFMYRSDLVGSPNKVVGALDEARRDDVLSRNPALQAHQLDIAQLREQIMTPYEGEEEEEEEDEEIYESVPATAKGQPTIDYGGNDRSPLLHIDSDSDNEAAIGRIVIANSCTTTKRPSGQSLATAAGKGASLNAATGALHYFGYLDQLPSVNQVKTLPSDDADGGYLLPFSLDRLGQETDVKYSEQAMLSGHRLEQQLEQQRAQRRNARRSLLISPAADLVNLRRQSLNSNTKSSTTAHSLTSGQQALQQKRMAAIEAEVAANQTPFRQQRRLLAESILVETDPLIEARRQASLDALIKKRQMGDKAFGARPSISYGDGVGHAQLGKLIGSRPVTPQSMSPSRQSSRPPSAASEHANQSLLSAKGRTIAARRCKEDAIGANPVDSDLPPPSSMTGALDSNGLPTFQSHGKVVVDHRIRPAVNVLYLRQRLEELKGSM